MRPLTDIETQTLWLSRIHKVPQIAMMRGVKPITVRAALERAVRKIEFRTGEQINTYARASELAKKLGLFDGVEGKLKF